MPAIAIYYEVHMQGATTMNTIIVNNYITLWQNIRKALTIHYVSTSYHS